MRIIVAPGSLRASASLLLLSIPLAGIQLMLVQRAQWWRIPYAEVAMAAGIAALLAVPTAIGIVRGSRVMWRVGAVMATLWCLASAGLAISREYTTLGYFSIFLAGYLIATFRWAHFELSRSYLDPRMSWYQGSPRGIPSLSCRVVSSEKPEAEFRVCRLDTEGAYLFSPELSRQGKASELENWESAELLFKYRDSEIRCKGRARAALQVGAGVGYEFVGLQPDERKDLGDFVESLRGVGYVE